MLSTKIGKLFEMARKNMFAPMVSEGNSRATCWIDICRLLKPVPAVRLYADRRVCAVCSSLSTLWIWFQNFLSGRTFTVHFGKPGIGLGQLLQLACQGDHAV